MAKSLVCSIFHLLTVAISRAVRISQRAYVEMCAIANKGTLGESHITTACCYVLLPQCLTLAQLLMDKLECSHYIGCYISHKA